MKNSCYLSIIFGSLTFLAWPQFSYADGGLPPDFQPVVVNGVTYYTDNELYYLYTSGGYKVVSSPVIQAITICPSNMLTVNVPSDGGGYVIVTFKKSGNGFVGPQGEFYPVFPQGSQLRSMYGR